MLRRLDEAPLLALIAVRSDARPDLRSHGHLSSAAPRASSREESAEIIDLVTEGSALDAQLREKILVATDGVPLFVEELTKVLLEAQGASPSPSPTAKAAQGVVIPATIQDSLTARLDRLGEAKQVAQVAATIGREFSRDLLAAVTRYARAGAHGRPGAPGKARAWCWHWTPPASGSPSSTPWCATRPMTACYGATRRNLHARIVEALEASFPAVIAANPELAAQHCTEAETFDKAVGYWMLAGRQAVARSAHVEAVSHLERGLQQLRRLPRRWRRTQGGSNIW